jgi:hypothetical protein
MRIFEDRQGRPVRFTEERLEHMLDSHPEMRGQVDRIAQTLSEPERIVRSRTDPDAELSDREYDETPVTRKFLCAVVKGIDDRFLVTAYFTDSIKRGEVLWEKP